MKKFFAFLLTFAMLFSLAMPAMAADVNGNTTGDVTAKYEVGPVEITGMEYYGDEANYDADTNTYTVVIPAGTTTNVDVGVKLIGTNLDLAEGSTHLQLKQNDSVFGECIHTTENLIDHEFTITMHTRVDCYRATYQYSNDGGASWSDEILNVEVKHGYSVTVNESVNGTVTADKSLVAPGDTVNLNVSPAENYALDVITVTDAEGNTVTVENNRFTMPASAVTVSATFKNAPKYNITVNESENGSVSADMQTATEGTTVTLTVTPENGYKLSELTVMNGETPVEVTPGENNTYTFTMPAGDVTVDVTFEKITYTINIGTYEGGSVVASVNGETVTKAAEGDTVTLTVTTTGIYQLKSIAVKDASNNAVEFATTGEASGIYTFVMPASDVAVEAVIEENRIVSADLIWGSLAYTYTDENGWADDGSEGAGTVTVTNTGESSFIAKATYLAEADYMNIRGTFDNGATTLAAGENQSFKLTLHNRPKRALSGQKIGTVTVHISETEFADYVTVTNELELLNALIDGGAIKFANDITASDAVTISSDVTIDLNSFTFDGIILVVAENVNVSISGGTIDLRPDNMGGNLTISDCTINGGVYALNNIAGTTTLSNTTVNSGTLRVVDGAIICDFNPPVDNYSVATDNGDGTWTVTKE